MSSPREFWEFREFALDCLRRAQDARDETERQLLLDFAARWMGAVIDIEARFGDGDAPFSSKEFRELALDCVHRLENARDETERRLLLDLAARWMRAVINLEARLSHNDARPSQRKGKRRPRPG
jgi:hypothetical protein